MNFRIPAMSVLLIAGIFNFHLTAETAPWTFSNNSSVIASHSSSKAIGIGALFKDLSEAFIGLYRKYSGQNSVSRCLFHVTCSHFAERAVGRYGLLIGTVVFIDRYAYRENSDSHLFYPLVGEPDGTYRLDDSPFVP